MLWYVCFFAALLLIVLAVRIVVSRSMGKMRMLYVMALGAAAAYVIYIPPFFAEYDFFSALFGDLIHVFQVATIDADFLEFDPLIRASMSVDFFADIYFFGMAVVHILVPAAFAMTAVTLVMQYLTRIQLSMIKRRKRDLHVFSYISERSEMLARDIRANDKRCDIVFLDSREERDYTDLRSDLRCSVLDEEMENIRADAKRRNVYYYCITPEEERNLNHSLALLGNFETLPPEEQQNHEIFIFSSDPDAELLLDSVHKGRVNVRIIDEELMAVYHLLEKYPLPHYAKDGKISVLISGFTQAGRAALRSVAWVGQLRGFKLSVTLLAKNGKEEIEDFKVQYPNLFTDLYDICCLSYATEAQFRDYVKEYCPDANYVIVCESEADTTDRAVALRRLFYRLDETFTNAPPIFAYMENPDKARAIALLRTAENKEERRMSYAITPFGMISEIYTRLNLSASPLEGFAKNVHLVYEDIFSDTGVDVDSALERYNFFEVNKKSNRANALHIRYKLALLGLDYTDDPNAEEVDLSAYLTDEILEQLTLGEHDRWQAFLESEGWETATVEQSKIYQASGISKGRHQCPLLKVHPYICPFDDLAARSEALGLPDSTVYDRDLITRIPDILHDRWGVLGKKYKIVKMNEE